MQFRAGFSRQIRYFRSPLERGSRGAPDSPEIILGEPDFFLGKVFYLRKVFAMLGRLWMTGVEDRERFRPLKGLQSLAGIGTVAVIDNW